MKGVVVIIRDFKKRPLLRKIWKEGKSVFYVLESSQFELLNKGEKGIGPIGFPKEDVFKYDPHLASSMEDLYKSGKWDWNKLVPF